MDRESKEYQIMRDKALLQLRSGESLTGKDGAFGPLLKEFLEPVQDRLIISLRKAIPIN